eukprot:TRINITY_DN6979_c0_g2_i1.p1 TRINITY_DN6979_c0_g2~~TRINITY_DN6979_c0_g2_i1.p1  ORF type:complete len:183 (-),score=26.25 TRINITY_DN6979_c0_g2_i1:2-496(-)
MAMLVNMAQQSDQDGLVRYALPLNSTVRVGREPDNDIVLSAYRVRGNHCTIANDNRNENIYISPLEGAETRVNGQIIYVRTQLKHNDRLCFGADLLFRVDTHPAYVISAKQNDTCRLISVVCCVKDCWLGGARSILCIAASLHKMIFWSLIMLLIFGPPVLLLT